ncbi:MAG: SHOCT domain-containing protein [Flavobacteriaceae bacterium]|nr:SHOCT domain-containing protein [Flavobacteriaceae bacterium]
MAVNYEGQLCYIELKPSKTIPKLYQEIKKIMPIVNNNQVLGSADELQKFADLRDQGIITNDEFEAKKKQILGL